MPIDPIIADYIASRAAEPRLFQMGPTEAKAYMAAKQMKTWPGAAPVTAQDMTIPMSWGACAARLYRATNACLPLMVFYHGGGFMVGSLDTHDGLCRSIAGSAGMAVLSVDYRLAPEHPWPAGQDDATAAIPWARGQAAALNIDADRVVVGGDSAGGHLAAVAALRLAEDAPVQGQVMLYPVTNAPGGDHASARDLATGFGLTAGDIAFFWEHYMAGKTPSEALLLQHADLANAPPTFLATAEYDPLRDEGEAFAIRLIEAGVSVTARRYLGVNHAFLAFAGLIPGCDALYSDLSRWVRALTGETS